MKKNRSATNSHHHLVRGVILIGFMLLIFRLLLTGDMTLLIAPKMLRFIYFTLFVFLFLGVLLIFRGTTSEHSIYHCECGSDHSYPKSKIKSFLLYSLFIVPISTGFLFANNVLDSSVAKNRSIQLGGNSQELSTVQSDNSGSGGSPSAADASQPKTPPENNSASIELPEPLSPSEYSSLKDALLQADTIMITDKSYVPMMNIIQENLPDLLGKTITTKGFVLRDKHLFQDQIIVARYGISCCIADASVYGMMAKGNVAKLLEDQWVEVTGQIDQAQYDGATIPTIKIKQMKKISAPKSPYVYDVGIKIK